jgi:hypothetical protein
MNILDDLCPWICILWPLVQYEFVDVQICPRILNNKYQRNFGERQKFNSKLNYWYRSVVKRIFWILGQRVTGTLLYVPKNVNKGISVMACTADIFQITVTNFERVHPVVFILMYWIYLLPSTQQTIGYNGFTTCFDSHESSSGYVQNQLFVVLTVINKSNTLTVISFCQHYFLRYYVVAGTITTDRRFRCIIRCSGTISTLKKKRILSG